MKLMAKAGAGIAPPGNAEFSTIGVGTTTITPGYNPVMPTICVFDGIKIMMYYRDHMPPHFHAEHADEAAEREVGIDPILVLEGELSRIIRGKVFEWAAIHQAELRANWELARAGLPLLPVAPLD